ncbi:hypothetical protein PAHAL_3G078000 [Panicum hallii]|uniref:Uncharacterized protein n=1 Tax=Panicum hallii TaxID=206008 RepID=A0A2S3H730_9POAL|nr:uncharacterized protein LOC112887830 [Panicum hallii]PAN16694.1 hypothetical protein PAHAL_3G078000 [Panicum hallii]
MGLLVQLPNLAGVRLPAAAAIPQSCRGGRLIVSAAAPGGPVKEEEEANGAGKKEKIVIRVSDPVRERRLPPPLFSAPDEPSERPPDPEEGWRRGDEDGEEAKKQYYVNMGDAIRKLREELPVVFYREPSFDIYRDDIVFKDPLNNFKGIGNYKRIFRALRFTGQIFFKAVWIDIFSIWQPVDNVIMIRWIVHGIPRVPWEGNGRFDGTSEYKLDKNGKIYEHKVDNIARNSPTKFKVLPVVELIRSLGCPSTPKPTYFETSCLALMHWRHFG